MCEPMTIAAVSMSALSGIAAHQGQQAQADAMRARNARQTQYAREKYRNDLTQLSKREQQENAAASQKLHQNRVEALKAKATARVSASEAGVSGFSVDNLIDDLTAQELGYARSVKTNLNDTMGQIDQARLGARDGLRSTINSLPTPVEPSFAGTALRIGADAMSSWGAYGNPRQDLKDLGLTIR